LLYLTTSLVPPENIIYTKFHYKHKLSTQYFSQDRVRNGFQVDVAIIRQIVEDVGSADGLRTSLAISKDKINPVM